MAVWRVIELSLKQLQRLKVIENAVAGHITVPQAGELLDLSHRQVQRLKGRCRPGQVDWVRHGNWGRPKPWRLLRRAGMRSPQKRRPPRYRSRRERKARFGMMVLADASRERGLRRPPQPVPRSARWLGEQHLYQMPLALDYTPGAAPRRPRTTKRKLPRIYVYAGRPAVAVRP